MCFFWFYREKAQEHARKTKNIEGHGYAMSLGSGISSGAVETLKLERSRLDYLEIWFSRKDGCFSPENGYPEMVSSIIYDHGLF